MSTTKTAYRLHIAESNVKKIKVFEPYQVRMMPHNTSPAHSSAIWPGMISGDVAANNAATPAPLLSSIQKKYIKIRYGLFYIE